MIAIEKGVIDRIVQEVRRAEQKHPGWPTDIVHATAVMVEEAGETMQAALDNYYSGGDIKLVAEEAIQTGAMAIRLLSNLRKQGLI